MIASKRKKVCIVVGGDIGRSPRMQYHAASFLDEDYDVEMIGYRGSEPLEKLRNHRNLKFNYIYSCPEFSKYLPSYIAYVFKVLWQIITIFIALSLSNIPNFILVQNPPAIPVLGVCYIFSKIFKSKFVIDWHNYAYSLMGLSLGNEHLFVKLCKWFEFYIGQKANASLCVTKAMKEDLQVNHDIKSIVFYDRPPEFFKETTVKEKHMLFSRLGKEHDIFVKDCAENETIFTKLLSDSEVILRKDRPAFLISSTSWTEDEDFSILLSALEEYEDAKSRSENIPALVCAISGKGPLKEYYKDVISRKNWNFVTIITLWLDFKDYPAFIGSADLGVCLHKSSSGLDLPMKVVDMFGCFLPVCALNFKCISELVKHNENGFVFNNSDELASQIKQIFNGFPKRRPEYDLLKQNINSYRSLKWHENWNFNVNPIFSESDNFT